MAAEDTLAITVPSTLALSVCKMMPLARLLVNLQPDTHAADGVAERGSRMSPGCASVCAVASTQSDSGGEAGLPETPKIVVRRVISNVAALLTPKMSPTRNTGLHARACASINDKLRDFFVHRDAESQPGKYVAPRSVVGVHVRTHL